MNPNEAASTVVEKVTDTAWIAPLVSKGAEIGIHIIGAILLWIVGRWLIGLVLKITDATLLRQKTDPTLIRYAHSTLVGVLNIILVISILGTFGVQTTTFAALFAALGLAIGTAWGGLLANFAAGVFMIMLRPFKVGDFITAGGVTGTVTEIGPFATVIDTPDNIHTVVGNNKILSDNIQNFTHNAYRRIELPMQLDTTVSIAEMTTTLKTRMTEIPNVLTTPAPDVEVLQLKSSGPLLTVRPYCHNDHYWQVYFDTNRLINELAAAHNIDHSLTHVMVHGDTVGDSATQNGGAAGGATALTSA